MNAAIQVEVFTLEGTSAAGTCNGKQWTAEFEDFGQKWHVMNVNDFSFGERIVIAKAIRNMPALSHALELNGRGETIAEELARG